MAIPEVCLVVRHLPSSPVLATVFRCCWPHEQRSVILRELEEFPIFVGCHLGQGCIPLFLASESQDVSFTLGVWPGSEVQPDCETQEQGHPGAAGPISPLSPSVSSLRPPTGDGGSWTAPVQLSLPPPVLHARRGPGPLLSFPLLLLFFLFPSSFPFLLSFPVSLTIPYIGLSSSLTYLIPAGIIPTTWLSFSS